MYVQDFSMLCNFHKANSFIRCIVYEECIQNKTEKQKGCVILHYAIFVFRKIKIPTMFKHNISFGSVMTLERSFCGPFEIDFANRFRQSDIQYEKSRDNYAIIAI